MKRVNKVFVGIVAFLSIVIMVISIGVVYSYASDIPNNTIGNLVMKNNTTEKNIVENKTEEKISNVKEENSNIIENKELIETKEAKKEEKKEVINTNNIETTQTKQVQTRTQNSNLDAASKSDNYLVKDVPFIAQNPTYPNGCEAASTTMLLNYYGMKISLKDFINNYLNMDKVYTKNGVRYGPDPEVCYAGDPSSLHVGWGCFSTAIENAVNKLINQKYANQYTVNKNTGNASLPELAKSKKPFAVWTTISYNVVQGQYTWKSYDGKTTYTYPKNLHVIVVIGQDDNYYYVNDPLKSTGSTKIEKTTLEKSFDSMGRKAIMIDKK